VIVSPFLLNTKTKSDLGWAFVGLINAGRLKLESVVLAALMPRVAFTVTAVQRAGGYSDDIGNVTGARAGDATGEGRDTDVVQDDRNRGRPRTGRLTELASKSLAQRSLRLCTRARPPGNRRQMPLFPFFHWPGG
jgi:hypothetical protein